MSDNPERLKQIIGWWTQGMTDAEYADFGLMPPYMQETIKVLAYYAKRFQDVTEQPVGCREAFEFWAKDIGGGRYLDITRANIPFDPDDYAYPDTQKAWLAWRAAQATKRESVSQETLEQCRIAVCDVMRNADGQTGELDIAKAVLNTVGIKIINGDSR